VPVSSIVTMNGLGVVVVAGWDGAGGGGVEAGMGVAVGWNGRGFGTRMPPVGAIIAFERLAELFCQFLGDDVVGRD